MKDLKAIFFTAIFGIILASNAKSENPCLVMIPNPDTTNWGIGLIVSNLNDKVEGFTVKSKSECFIIDKKIVLINSGFKSEVVNSDYIYHCGYKVYQIKDTKYLICLNSIEGGIWIDFDKLSETGHHFETYLSFIATNKNILNVYSNIKTGTHVNMGVNLINSCLNLRSEPSIESKIIACLPNNLQKNSNHTTTHLEIQFVINGWAYLIARTCIFDGDDTDNPDGCAITVIKEYVGYVKVIGDGGRPNLWYGLSGY